MSFRMFVYYCAVGGGCAAFVGWTLGRESDVGNTIRLAGIKGTSLGMLLAFGLSMVDCLGSFSGRMLFLAMPRVLFAGLIGGTGGLLGGMIGQALYNMEPLSAFLVFGWMLTALLIGASLGAFDLLTQFVRGQDTLGARRKILNGMIGGIVGGFLGGAAFLAARHFWAAAFADKPVDLLWSPSATGFVALGLCIGLAIGLAQVILKQAWVRVEHGFRAGREVILAQAETTIGRAESATIGLFGDPALEHVHARIVRRGDRHLLVDTDTAGGTFVNGARIGGPTLLYSGDRIQVGNGILQFNERTLHSQLQQQ
jgi:hypothetical protein